MNSTLFSDPPLTKDEYKERIKEDEEWDKENLPLEHTKDFSRKELLSDIILQIYIVLVYTVFWSFVNNIGINMLYSSLEEKFTAYQAGIQVFNMMLFMTMLGILPIRIVYWIEYSLVSITKTDKKIMWSMFAIAVFFTCLPTIITFFKLFLFR